MHARITLEDTALFADPAGALFWPARKTLVVADLHLEKGSAFAAKGVPLPPWDTRATLMRLQSLVRKYTPERVVCLGDSFHDKRAGERIAPADSEFLARLVAAQAWVWIVGNHDPEIPSGIGGDVAAEIVEDALALRHEPADPAGLRWGEIVGHFHPKAAVSTAAGRVTAPCFLLDGRRMVMPAFGAYAGGLDVLDPAISRLFGRVRVRALLLGRDRLHLFPGHKLEPVVGGNRSLK
ncbi:MAG: ligase-associated DNA damage response endonuclease PdeM [Alphaproteobacteria bacterium]|nr:ligase-associated DNA damage response endonuclease PdeM [Alphaproteobacteria bacterium]